MAEPTQPETPQTAQARPAFHALAPEEVASLLHTGPRGLCDDEVRARLEIHGPNALEAARPPGILATVLHQFTSPIIYILLVATVVTLLLEEWVDAGVIAAVLLLNAVIGFVQERHAERAVQALRKLLALKARVIREGVDHEIEGTQLVPGDLVLLEPGARVPADLRLMAANNLAVDESLLTGESKPSRKQVDALAPDTALADRSDLAFAGTIVTTGRARGYVVATGGASEIGRIAKEVREARPAPTPMQIRMTRFARLVAVVALAASALVMLIGVLRGGTPSEMFLVAVAVAVSAVPEGLPVAVTITLAIGVSRMARRNAIIRRLPVVETLGSTSVIGSDKTGTLTENRMTVEELWTADGTFRPGDVPALAEHHPLGHTLRVGVLTNEASVHPADGEWELHGDPTEAALLVAAERTDLPVEQTRSEWALVSEVPFEPERAWSAAVRECAGRRELVLKGAPERVLGMCDRMARGDGLAALEPERVAAAAADMARRGLRVLAMAFAPLPSDALLELGEPSGLIFAGLAAMRDPPRAGVVEAIEGCRMAGIRVLMITGDHPDTARSIGAEIGIGGESPRILTGRDLDGLSEPELVEAVAEVSVYARTAPEHKLRVVRALQARGEVVAVTGDGVNDAPALKAASVGVAMGRSGTDVAREASDMVLADDAFVSIHGAVHEGRITFDNVRKVTFFLVSTGAAEIVAILTVLAFGWPLPYLPAQILWLNLVTNGLQDVALAFEPGDPDVLKRPPRSTREGILSRLLWERTFLVALVMAAGTLWLFLWSLETSGDLERARTVALTTMVVFQVFHVGNSRSERLSAFSLSPFSNRFLFVATTAAVLVHVGALYFPPTQFVLRLVPLGFEAWTKIVGVAASVVVVVEVEKALRRLRRSRADRSRDDPADASG